ncbi:MAG: UDP-3-O-[3-hydroxymyristoyl] N-acetylglucosamine deacetylase [Leptospiraceae bacterium]|nr:UDP-3-O-[3-hydroxymyristoyl] N-acetylglucosamine deacetylase [Leptospiraceae bacterium]
MTAPKTLPIDRIGRENRATVDREVLIEGTGIHTGEKGRITLKPAEAGTGLIFKGTGSRIGDIPVSPFYAMDGVQAVTLGNRHWQIKTVEHLLCAMAAAGISDCIMETTMGEVPILDGSSLPFYEKIIEGGVRDLGEPMEALQLSNPVWVIENDRYVVALPSDHFKVTYTIDYPHPMLRGQTMTLGLNAENLIEDVLPARTFGFLRDVEELRKRGLIQGGSLDNAVVLTEDGYLNDDLRFEDECLRHKILDLVGDLYLLGRPLKAHIVAFRAGHSLDISLGKKIQTRIAMDELATRKDRIEQARQAAVRTGV